MIRPTDGLRNLECQPVALVRSIKFLQFPLSLAKVAIDL
jgi:hypothetical protein